jgi:hypothetical protein
MDLDQFRKATMGAPYGERRELAGISLTYGAAARPSQVAGTAGIAS